MTSHKKRVRLFHPRKLWVGLGTLALTIGVGIGEAHVSQESNPVLHPVKLNQTIETSTFNVMGGTKQGARRLPYLVSKLTSKDANPLETEEPSKEGVKSICFYEDTYAEGESATYAATVSEVKVSESIQGGDEFRVEVYVQNTGNTTWFGRNAGCEDKPVTNLGTSKTQDRSSVFFHEGDQTGWIGDNRIQMIEDAAKPGETATFAFTSLAPDVNSIYREYFGIVTENVGWIADFDVAVDIRIGEVAEDDELELNFFRSVSADTATVAGDRSILVDLSDQSLSLVIGETPVYTMTISSGASSTPTPTGSYKIMSKQELRVGGESPHYRMPYFQMFTSVGHGLHALPYLGSTEGGWFWEEAQSHIGIPVSHGCVRMLPDDAVTTYEFTDVGTVITIQR